MRPRVSNPYLPTGVSMRGGKYRAMITICGECIYLGAFKNVEDAKEIFDAAYAERDNYYEFNDDKIAFRRHIEEKYNLNLGITHKSKIIRA
jgi:hypothetical protein